MVKAPYDRLNPPRLPLEVMTDDDTLKQSDKYPNSRKMGRVISPDDADYDLIYAQAALEHQISARPMPYAGDPFGERAAADDEQSVRNKNPLLKLLSGLRAKH